MELGAVEAYPNAPRDATRDKLASRRIATCLRTNTKGMRARRIVRAAVHLKPASLQGHRPGGFAPRLLDMNAPALSTPADPDCALHWRHPSCALICSIGGSWPARWRLNCHQQNWSCSQSLRVAPCSVCRHWSRRLKRARCRAAANCRIDDGGTRQRQYGLTLSRDSVSFAAGVAFKEDQNDHA